jgi:heptosyltransferase-2
MKSFLIIQTAFIGDVVLATPVIEKLKEFYPTADIDFMLRKGNEGLLEGHPHLRKVWIWDKKNNKYGNLLKLIYQVRYYKYDCIINIQRFFAAGLLSALSGARIKIGFAKNPWSFTYQKKIGHRLLGQHETSRNLSLVVDLTDKTYVRPRLYPTEADYEFVKKYQDRPYLCIAPASVWKTKEYPQLKWVELILAQDDAWKIYLIGGPNDAEKCEEICDIAEKKGIVNLAGKLTYLQTAALMKGATMNYVNDSAPLHFASAVNAPTNAVFCSTIPSFGFGPLANHSKVIETEKPLACRPCGLHGKKKCPLGHFECAHTIRKRQFDILACPASESETN